MHEFSVLSIMEDYLGHKTYANLLKEYFRKPSKADVDFYWYTDERKLGAKLVRKLLSYSIPNRWIAGQNIDFNHARIQTSYAYMARQLALRKLRQKQYAALHLHTYILGFLSTDLMKRLPTVVSLDMTSYQFSKEKTDPNFMWTHTPNFWMGKRVFDAAAKVATRSEWARQSVIRDYQIDPDKVTVLYPGVDVERLKPPAFAERPADKPFKILFIGGDFERKGGHDVLDVFLTSFADGAELHLVTQAPIPHQHPNLHVYTNVKAYTPEWIRLYHEADVFVMPTLFEGFGWVFIEAMAAGLPVIATRINAIPEMVSHGETGFLIEPGDRADLAAKIRCLMENPDLAQAMGRKGRQVVEQTFNAALHHRQLDSIFAEIALQPVHS